MTRRRRGAGVIEALADGVAFPRRQPRVIAATRPEVLAPSASCEYSSGGPR
jgi:hypothetical protein